MIVFYKLYNETYMGVKLDIVYIVYTVIIKGQKIAKIIRVIKTRNNCTSCGMGIFKSAIDDAYLCRMCERTMSEEELYAHLDMQ